MYMAVLKSPYKTCLMGKVNRKRDGRKSLDAVLKHGKMVGDTQYAILKTSVPFATLFNSSIDEYPG